MNLYKLTEHLRGELKKPLGSFVSDINELKAFKTMICVGDSSSERVLKSGLKPKVCVYDNMCLRKKIDTSEDIKKFKARELAVSNPAGYLNDEVFSAIEDSLSYDGSTKLFVEGEEDLVTLAAIMLAPMGSVVVYGQPNEGLVAVNVDEKIKNKVKNILSEMKI